MIDVLLIAGLMMVVDGVLVMVVGLCDSWKQAVSVGVLAIIFGGVIAVCAYENIRNNLQSINKANLKLRAGAMDSQVIYLQQPLKTGDSVLIEFHLPKKGEVNLHLEMTIPKDEQPESPPAD